MNQIKEQPTPVWFGGGGGDAQLSMSRYWEGRKVEQENKKKKIKDNNKDEKGKKKVEKENKWGRKQRIRWRKRQRRQENKDSHWFM